MRSVFFYFCTCVNIIQMTKLLYTFTSITLIFSCSLFAQNTQSLNTGSQSSAISKDMTEDTLDFYNESLYEASPSKNIFVLLVENPQLLPDVSVTPDVKELAINIKIPETYKFLDIKLYDKNFTPLLTRRRTPGLISMDISGFNKGIYYLKLINTQTKDNKTYRLLKKQ